MTKCIFLFIFGVIAVIGILTLVTGFVQLFYAELSAAYVPRDVLFQRMNSASSLAGTGFVVALVGVIPFYLLLKTEPTRRHRRR